MVDKSKVVTEKLTFSFDDRSILVTVNSKNLPQQFRVKSKTAEKRQVKRLAIIIKNGRVSDLNELAGYCKGNNLEWVYTRG